MCRDSQMELFAFEPAADHEAVRFDKSGDATWRRERTRLVDFARDPEADIKYLLSLNRLLSRDLSKVGIKK